MGLFKRAPREFTVVLGDPVTINDVPSSNSRPEDIVAEIYDIAELFPVSITIVSSTGKDIYIELDENGDTKELESSEPLDSDDDLNEEDRSDEHAPHSRPSKLKLPSFQFPPIKKKTAALGGGAILALAVVVAVGIQFWNGSASANQSSWQTPLPEIVSADKPFSDLFGEKVWGIDPGQADSVSWFAAGVVQTNEDKNEIALRALSNGKVLGTYTAAKGINIKKDLKWVADLSFDDRDAVGIRIADVFVTITDEGKVTQWKLPQGFEVSARGTVPLMSNAATQQNATKVEYFALKSGKNEPAKLTVNPDLITRSVDGSWIIQLDLNSPTVALTPVDRTGKNHAHPVTLKAPTEQATFTQHLAAGHGYSLALWNVDGKFYLGVHSLSGDAPGETTSFVPAPFSQADAKGWVVTPGAELAIVGPYAFSLDTGKLEEYNPASDFTRAYGELAIASDTDGSKILTLNNKQYPEVDRIVGYSEEGMSVVRLIDGSVAAYRIAEDKE